MSHTIIVLLLGQYDSTIVISKNFTMKQSSTNRQKIHSSNHCQLSSKTSHRNVERPAMIDSQHVVRDNEVIQVPTSEQHSYRHLYKHYRLTQCKIFLGILIYCTIYVRGFRQRCARMKQSTDVNVHRKENESVPIIASGCSVNLQSKSSNN